MCSASGKESKRLRFSADDDLALLRECISQNPLEDAEKWENVQKNVHEITGKKFSIRTLKDHLFLILEIWLQKDSDNQKKSGVEEIYSERDHLLQEISDLCNNANINPRECRKRKRINKEQQIAELGRRARENCALQLKAENTSMNNSANILDHDYLDTFHVEEIEVVGTEVGADDSTLTFNASSSSLKTDEIRDEKQSCEDAKKSEPIKRILGPTKFRNNKSASMRKGALDYLNHKEERDYVLKAKELDLLEKRLQLDEKKLKLEERRQALEEHHQKERLEMEKERLKQELFERNQSVQIIEYQQQLIKSLMDRLKKYEDC